METLTQLLNNETTMMFVAGIGVVILLVIVLIVVIFSAKASSYAHRLKELQKIDTGKSEKMQLLDEELQELKMAHVALLEQLQQFDETKEVLRRTKLKADEYYGTLKEVETRLAETQTKLHSSEMMHEQLMAEHQSIKQQAQSVTEENSKFRTSNARLLTKLESQTQHTQAQMEMMKSHREELKSEFESLARRVFEGNSQKFAEFSKESLDSMIKPLQTQISEFKKQVSDTYNVESRERAVLKNEIHSLKALNEKISQDAINLTNALKGESKQQGVWGEMVLEHVLEASGLRKGFEFEREVSLRTDDNDLLRPDVVVHLPDKRDLIIDAKTSLVAYERYVNAESESDREAYLKSHLDSVRLHVDSLSKKNYERLKEVETLDFIFMFMPIEGALALALEYDNSIYDEAFRGKILLVGPTTLLVAMRAVENVWKYEQQNRNAREIARRAGAMYDKFVGFSEDILRISRQIDTIQNSFSAARSKLSDGKGNLVKQAEQLKELGAQSSKTIPKELS